jgi:hypothetical protein
MGLGEEDLEADLAGGLVLLPREVQKSFDNAESPSRQSLSCCSAVMVAMTVYWALSSLPPTHPSEGSFEKPITYCRKLYGASQYP